MNNSNHLSPVRYDFKDYSLLSKQVLTPVTAQVLVDRIIVSRVRPASSKGITDLFLPHASICLSQIVLIRRESPSRKIVPSIYELRSRSLSESTRQITPPTKNGHAPPPIESRKSSQSVNPHHVWTR